MLLYEWFMNLLYFINLINYLNRMLFSAFIPPLYLYMKLQNNTFGFILNVSRYFYFT